MCSRSPRIRPTSPVARRRRRPRRRCARPLHTSPRSGRRSAPARRDARPAGRLASPGPPGTRRRGRWSTRRYRGARRSVRRKCSSKARYRVRHQRAVERARGVQPPPAIPASVNAASARASASSVPEMTTCSGALSLAIQHLRQPEPVQYRAGLRVAAAQRRHPGGRRGRVAHQFAAGAGQQEQLALRSKAPAVCSATSSPKLCPADAIGPSRRPRPAPQVGPGSGRRGRAAPTRSR